MNIFSNNWKYLNWIFGVFLVLYAFYSSKMIQPDTIGYIEAYPIRSAGYTSIVILFESLFGKFGLKLLVFIQAVLTLFSIQYFLKFLKRIFKLSDFVILLIAFISYFYLYKIGTNLATDLISFAIFLFCMKFFFEAILEDRPKSLYWFYGLLIVLVLIRSQFYFLYPITLLGLVFWYFKNGNLRFFLKNIGLLALIIITTNLLDRSYHYVKHGSFMGTPFTGLQLVTDALYISEESDSLLFDGVKQEMFNKIYSNLEDKNLLMGTLVSKDSTIDRDKIIHHYNYAYNEICHRNAKIIIGSYFKNPRSIGYWKSIDTITIDMALKIIAKHPKKFFKMYTLDIMRNGFFNSFFFLFFTLTFIYCMSEFYKDQEDKVLLFLLLSSIIVISNFLLVALVEPILERYSFYTTVLYYTALFILFVKKGTAKA